MGLWNSSQMQEDCTTWKTQHMLVMDGMTNHKYNKEEEEEEEEEEESKDFEQDGSKESEDTEGLNLKETEENKSNEYVLVNTVQGHFKAYTRHKIKNAQEAAVSLLLNLGAAQQGRSMMFSGEKKILFKGWKKGFVMNTKLDFMRC